MADASRDIITRQVSTTMGRLHVSDHAGDEPALVGQLILLNTYYGRAPALCLPEMISLFGGDPLDPDSVAVAAIVPQFFGEAGRLDALPAIRAWTAALACDLDAQDQRIAQGQLAGLDIPVGLVFGALDRYLTPHLAANLASLFPTADTHLVDGASHWPQCDRPKAVAELIR